LGPSVEKLDQENPMKRSNRLIFAVCAFAGGVVGGLAAAQIGASGAIAATHRASRTIKAERFVVVGSHGEERITLQVTKLGVADVALLDTHGRSRTELRVTPDGAAGLGFYNADGGKRLVLGLTSEDKAGLSVFSDGRQIIGMSANKTGEMALTMYDPKSGLARAGLGLGADGSPALIMLDTEGKPRLQLGLSKDGNGNLTTMDKSGKTVSALPMPQAATQSAGQ
jgi:hypothetical protein